MLRNSGQLLHADDIVAHSRTVRDDQVEEIVELPVEFGQARQVVEQVMALAA